MALAGLKSSEAGGIPEAMVTPRRPPQAEQTVRFYLQYPKASRAHGEKDFCLTPCNTPVLPGMILTMFPLASSLIPYSTVSSSRAKTPEGLLHVIHCWAPESGCPFLSVSVDPSLNLSEPQVLILKVGGTRASSVLRSSKRPHQQHCASGHHLT